MAAVLDLFSGAGGFTLGLHAAGHTCAAAVEVDRFACETFAANFPHAPLFQRDIHTFSDQEIRQSFGGVEAIVGGPPCQGFSVAGPAQYGKIDQRNDLILEFARVVRAVKPPICVVENVKGLLNGRLPSKQKAVVELQRELVAAGYAVELHVLQAAEFGVPQWRERVFVIGTLGCVRLPPPRPEFRTRNSWRSVRDAISDLPQISSGEGSDAMTGYDGESVNEYQHLMRTGSTGVRNHVAMKHTQRVIERFKTIPIGGSLVGVPPEFGQRIRNGSELDARMRFKSNNQRLHPDRVSLAITASFQSNFVHPWLDRNFTAREGARLQSFPDSFIFKGPRTLMSRTLLEREGRVDEIGLSQYNQIGNAVPPLVARAWGQAIAQALGENNEQKF
jgi:DNA (cytosine-5)-methyltransferase 1